MIKINKRKVIITSILVLCVAVLVSGTFLSGLYIGKKGNIKFWNGLKSERSEKNINTQKSYDLSTCNESTANIAEELSDSVVTVSIKKLNVKTDLDSILTHLISLIFIQKE